MMFGLGIGEILIVALVAFICIRPKDLPKVFRALGRFYKKVTVQLNTARDLLDNMEKEITDQGQENETDNGGNI